MAEPARIQDIKERVRDFTGALRLAGAADLAQRVERHAGGFVEPGQVRRSVAAIQQQLQYFRANPDELPDLPIVQVAANRLEDVCREALAGGLIEAARPSLRAAGKRKLGVVVATLAGAGLCFLIPLGLTLAGVDWNDLLSERTSPLERLEQGDALRVQVNALAPAAVPDAVSGVEFQLKGRCQQDLGRGLRCRPSEPRDFDGVTLPSFEIMRENQAYGVFIGFAAGNLLGAVGGGDVLVAATWDTPEGRYELPLEAAFTGYSPGHCGLLERLQDQCQPARVGPGEKHAGVPVPTLMVEVVRGNPARATGVKRRQHIEQQQAAARERAEQLAENVVQIKAVLDDTQGMLRKQQWERVRERADKLNELFSPLDALVVKGGAGEALPVEVAGLRARFEEQRRQLQAFEDKAFDEAFAATRGEPTAPQPMAAGPADDARLAKVARKLRISPGYMDAIYAGHAEQLELRLAQVELARRAQAQGVQAALLRKCGALPTRAFGEVRAYLAAMAHAARVSSELRECMTPRLSDKSCWSVVCSFDEIVAGEFVDKAKPHQWTFMLRNARVVDHVERVLK